MCILRANISLTINFLMYHYIVHHRYSHILSLTSTIIYVHYIYIKSYNNPNKVWVISVMFDQRSNIATINTSLLVFIFVNNLKVVRYNEYYNKYMLIKYIVIYLVYHIWIKYIYMF